MGSIDKDPKRLTGKGFAVAGISMGAVGTLLLPVLGVLIALLLPAVQSAREAARRTQSANNLKQIGLALNNYEASYGTYPPAYTLDASGQPGLSWRVLILPYMEQTSLYEQFNLSESWESPTNRALIDQMPDTYICPSHIDAEGSGTCYLAITGEGTAFPGDQPLSINSVRDGLSITLAVVESIETVPWTQPADFVCDLNQPGGGLLLPSEDPGAPPGQAIGSFHHGGFYGLFLDGSVRFLSYAISSEELSSLLSIDGGEVLNAEQF